MRHASNIVPKKCLIIGERIHKDKKTRRASSPEHGVFSFRIGIHLLGYWNYSTLDFMREAPQGDTFSNFLQVSPDGGYLPGNLIRILAFNPHFYPPIRLPPAIYI